MPTAKTCGHPPNPVDDKDKTGRPYESCFTCFMNDLSAHEKAMRALRLAALRKRAMEALAQRRRNAPAVPVARKKKGKR